METRFRADLIAWLRTDPALSASVNAVEEESPVSASPPWIGIAASASRDWGAKDMKGREVRIALELVDRRDEGSSSASAAIVEALEARIAALPPAQSGYRVVVTRFRRSRAERRKRNLRAILLEYEFGLIAA